MTPDNLFQTHLNKPSLTKKSSNNVTVSVILFRSAVTSKYAIGASSPTFFILSIVLKPLLKK